MAKVDLCLGGDLQSEPAQTEGNDFMEVSGKCIRVSP